MGDSGPSILFIGAHAEAAPALRFLIERGERLLGLITFDARSLAQMSGGADLAAIAQEHGIPVQRVRHINEPGVIDWARALAPDLLIVLGWTQLLNQQWLSLPGIAPIGCHASLLPKYRGRAPINWAIINGETETGNTLLVLAPGADEGQIIAQRRIPIGPDDDCGTLYARVAECTVDMLAEALAQIRSGGLVSRPQPADGASVMPQRRQEDGIIDWTLPAPRLHDWVRALTHPYPGAFTTLPDGDTLWVWRARAVPDSESASMPPIVASPGTVRREFGRVFVQAGTGAIELLSVQRAGGPEQPAVDAGLRAGDRLRSPQVIAGGAR